MTAERPLWQRWLLPAAVVLAGANLVGFLAWTLPREHEQRSAAARAEADRAAVRSQRAEAMALRQRATAVRSNGADLQRFYSRYAGTEKADLIPTLEEVEALARMPGLRPGTRNYSREPLEGLPLERLAISLPVEGTYDQLVSFLGEVERSPRFITIDGVSMQGKPGSAALRVELSTYLKVNPAEVRQRRARAR